MLFNTKSFLPSVLAMTMVSCSDPVIYQNNSFTWKGDTISLNDDSIKAYALDSKTIVSNYPEAEFPDGKWTAKLNLSQFPVYSAPTRLEEALYNLALEEVIIAVEPDSTLRTGKEWGGVWTRDVSYSILLGVSHLQTQASINSLVRKVDQLGRIIQDTGTGGSWPCSTDRNIWAVAAWEIYKVTGDKQWLEYIYPIIKRSLEDDILVSLNPQTGMLKGESSYLDWREQEYPRWMAPVDIYNSENLGTECVHYQAFSILAKLERMLGTETDAARYEAIAQGIRDGINKYLWMEDKGYYAQYLYGRQNLIASPRSETLGEALAVLYDIADSHRAASICSNVPCQDYGTACFFPNIGDIPPYHNDAMWPFVQAYWMNACKKAGNETGVMHSIATISRLAAFCLTNKENMVIYDGKWQGTQINSSRQLWSIAGNLTIVNNILFGMEWEDNGLRFNPFVPKALAGTRTLTGFRYRDGVYDITVEGYGSGIRSFLIDGVRAEAFIPAISANGHHTVNIVLNGVLDPSSINMTANEYSPLTPICAVNEDTLTWDSIEGVSMYKIIRSGECVATTAESSYKVAQDGEYQVIAVGENGYESFASEPVECFGNVIENDIEHACKLSKTPYKGFEGSGYIDLTLDNNTDISFTVDIPYDGDYAIDFRFANANGPINTKNKCAIRTLHVDGQRLGPVIMPHCGTRAFDTWRYTNVLKTRLSEGKHTFRMTFEPENRNMNIQTNSAALDCIRMIRL